MAWSGIAASTQATPGLEGVMRNSGAKLGNFLK
jgi:hypothetical protein